MDSLGFNGPGSLLYALVLVSSGLFGLLLGLWFGLRISTKDAALLARFASASEQAVERAQQAIGRAAVIEETVNDALAEAERKRAKARAAQQRAEAATTGAPSPEAAEMGANGAAPIPADLSPRERRRALARRLAARTA